MGQTKCEILRESGRIPSNLLVEPLRELRLREEFLQKP